MMVLATAAVVITSTYHKAVAPGLSNKLLMGKTLLRALLHNKFRELLELLASCLAAH